MSPLGEQRPDAEVSARVNDNFSGRLVVCLGDSITAGQVSANYVNLVSRQWRGEGLRVENRGVNGDLAYNVAARLDEVIALQPDALTLLVGTNDVNSQYDEKWLARYLKDQKLPTTPTQDWYGEQVDVILGRLRRETHAKLTVLTIPPLGEDLSSRMNGLVNSYNDTLREVAARHDVDCLPLHDRLVEQLDPTRTPPPYAGSIRKVMAAAARHLILRQSWDTISRRGGLTILTDHIHLNDRAAKVVADLISTFLRDSLK